MANTQFQRIISSIFRVGCGRYEAIISAASDDLATPSEIDALKAHLAVCESCRYHQAVVLASRGVLKTRPLKEVSHELSSRLVNAIAAEREAEAKNIRRGGGIGSPFALRPQLIGAMASVCIAAVALGVFWTRHSSTPTHTTVATAPAGNKSSHPILVATAPQNAHRLVAKHAAAPTHTVVASNSLITDSKSPVAVRAYSHPRIDTNSNNHSHASEIAFAPKPVKHDNPGPGSFSPQPKVTTQHTVVVAALPKSSEEPKPTIPTTLAPAHVEPTPMEVASANTGEHASPAATGNEPVVVDGHSHLLGEMRGLAQRTQQYTNGTVSLAAVTGRPNYSGAVEMVGSSFR